MGDRLKGKAAVVTGAGRGIGRAIALALAAEGAKVVINDLGSALDGSGASSNPATDVVTEIKERGGVAVANFDSVADYNAAQNIIQTGVDSFGKIDILVCCAGILRDRMIFNMAEAEWDDVIRVHLKGTFNCTRHACVLMRQQRSGRIITITSPAWLGTTGHANYAAAKGGIVSFTRAVARDMGSYGVTCNCIAPAAATRMTTGPEIRASWETRAARGVSMTALGEDLFSPPETVPPMLIYLCTDEAAPINGRVFAAWGNKVALYSEPVEVKGIYKETGPWTVEELSALVPKTLAEGLVNPAPPRPPREPSQPARSKGGQTWEID